MAKKKLGCGDTLVAMPAKLLITTTTVLESEIGSYIKRYVVLLGERQTWKKGSN